MGKMIAIEEFAGREVARYPHHPDKVLCEQVAAALNAGEEPPRSGEIQTGEYRQSGGAGISLPLRAAWLVKPSGFMLLLAVKPWDSSLSRHGQADRPWVPA